MNKKGFTLIELLATIVVIGIISVITTPTIIGVIERARKGAAESSALGYIDAIEMKTSTAELDGIVYEDKDDYVYDEIEVSVKGTAPTGGIYALNSNKVTAGTFCINNYTVEYSENKVKASTKCTGEDLKLTGSVKLSKSSTNISYPNIDTFEVIENKSGGNLTCETSDSSVATCSITNNTVTVKSGKKEGNATLTIKSEGNSKYKEATAAFVVVTAKGLISYTSNGYEGVYDGEEHGITVTSTNGIIKYGVEEGNYTLEQSPKYSDVGEYIVYYSITNEGYKEVTGSKTIKITKANGEIKLDKTSGSVGYNETLEINIEKNVSGSAIEAVSSNSDMASVQVEGNKVIVKGLEIGKVVITITSKATKNYKETSVTYDLTITKANNKLKLSSNTGSYTYPESGTFEVIENTSGGALSCTTSNKNIATCSITNNTVTVKTGTTKGVATLTIKSEATTNYNEGQIAYVVTTSPGLISYTANGYNGTYDGKSHGISVEASGATIKYGEASGTYDLDASPTRTNAGTTTVYYQITREGYNDITGSKDIVITKAEGSVIAPTAKTLTYNGSAQNLINAGSSTTGEIQYKIEGGSYSTNIPTGTSAGTYKVYYKVVGDKNHNDTAEASIDVTINKAKLTYSANGYSGTYDGVSHGISVEASGATIKYGEASGTYNQDTSPTYSDVGNYTVYYQITREGYITVESSETVTITKANNPLKLSENAATVTYPTSKTVTISGNTSGGALSCTSSNTAAATCSISGSTLTIKPGTTEASSVTITVKSASTKNYNEGQVAFVAVTANGLMSVTASGYTGTYDGASHGITVEASGATIKYGEASGTYDLDASPTRTDVGKTTVYYQVTRPGYKTVTGSKDIVITKAEGSVVAPTAKTLTYTGSAQTLINAGSSTTGEIQYKLGSGNYSTNLPTTTNAGTYTVYYKVIGDSNHNDVAEKSISVTIAKANGSVTVPTAKTLTYTGSAQNLINAGSSTTGEIQYKLGSGSYSTSIPTATSPGTYTVYYKVVGNSNHKDVAEKSISVTIAKANNPLKLSENAGTVTYPTSKTVTISGNTSGGALSCTSSNTAAATCSISGSTLTITPGTTEASSVTITVKSAATTNYNEGQVSFVAVTANGLMSVTASGYTGTYDGKAHGITVEASGATIKYGEASGTYDLDTSPTRTNAGTTTVYYQVTKTGYKTVTGSKTITINRLSNTLTLSATSGEVIKGATTTFTITKNTSGGSLSCTSSATSVATCSISGTTVSITGVSAGTAQITVSSAATTNYNAASKAYSVVVVQKNLADLVKLGDYVRMTPTSTSYTTDTSMTGYTSSQTINPSELNLWRVIRINSDGTVDMVSEYVSSVAVYFRGQTGYQNLVGYLNTIAHQYENKSYTVGARHMGYSTQTPYITDTSALTSTTAPQTSSTSSSNVTSASEAKGLGDVGYETDTNLVKTALGTLVANNPSGTATSYWLASRNYYYSSSSYWNYRGRNVNTSGRISDSNLYTYDSGFRAYSNRRAVRPIVTLKSNIQATGSGTSSDPYVLP